MTRFPRFLGPGWLLAYAVSGALWLLIEVAPLPLILALAAAARALGAAVALGNWISTGHAVPPEERR